MKPSLPPSSGDGASADGRTPLADQAARQAAVDPGRNVVLEASAGTGKTRVLVDRYVRLAEAGVDPANILAMTFTRKAAAEMRQRILARMRDAGNGGAAARDRRPFSAPGNRLGDVAISTIDAFCLSLLQEFPLEADVDPGFDVADEAVLPRLAQEALDRTLRICRGQARTDDDIALLFAQLGEARLRDGLSDLIDRRLVAVDVLGRVLHAAPRGLSVASACGDYARRLCDALTLVEGGLERFLDNGPIGHPGYALLASEIRALVSSGPEHAEVANQRHLRSFTMRLQAHLFTQDGERRKRDPYAVQVYPGTAARRAHWAAASTIAPAVDDAIRRWRRDVNAILSRAVWHVFAVAISQYERTLDTHGVLDFAGLLARARAMLERMPEFGRSRYLLESRYQHLLVDEFQDTSRAQWDLVRLLVRSWGEGLGLGEDMPVPPSIFVVGDRKQSIYGFRDAEVAVLGEAAGFVSGLRAGGEAGLSISHSFRSVPSLLAFANDLFSDVDKDPARGDAFRFGSSDRFPASAESGGDDGEEVLALAVGPSVRVCAIMVATEIAGLIGTARVRDRQTGLRRPALPGDIAILFRTRESHREFEQALESLAVPTYVYKGLGFFDAPEIVDIVSVVRFLADPASNLRAAALLRSRFVRLSDPGLRELGPGLARAITAKAPTETSRRLTHEDRLVLDLLRAGVARWLALADRLPPADLLDRVLHDTGYAAETRGPRLAQARENVKKIRALARRLQNRGYLTLARLAGHFERMSAGDESNAVVDALDAVNLMTVHAAKGLEFPIVFVVNLSRGTGAPSPPIRIAPDELPTEAVAVGDFHAAFDEEVPARDREETKRLLYVAVTRARDRLYLSSLVEDGRFDPRSGSLGDVLPRSLRELLGRAGQLAGMSHVEWAAGSGRSHRFRLCPAGDRARSTGSVPTVREAGGERRQMEPDIAPVADPNAAARVSVTGLVSEIAGASPSTGVARREALISGRLIHRLFQRAGPDDSAAGLEARAAGLLHDDERQSLRDSTAVARAAATAYRSMRLRPDVRAVLDQAECDFEVPFSLRLEEGNAVVRGVMDCVAVQPGGDIVVLDFKTGAPRPSDAEQLAVYERAARALFPGRRVEAKLVYGP